MTFACRKVQQPVNMGFFKREFTGQYHKQQPLGDLLYIVMGKQCLKN